MNNTSLIVSKINKNDDFYTFYEDIDKEVNNYLPCFRDKKVLCCMDSPKSNFWKFFVDNFHKLKIRKVVCISVGTDKGLVGTYLGTDKESYSFLEGAGDFRSEEVKDFIRKADIVLTLQRLKHAGFLYTSSSKYTRKHIRLMNLYKTFTIKDTFVSINDSIRLVSKPFIYFSF